MPDKRKEVPTGILQKSEARMAAVKAIYAADIHSSPIENPDPWALTLDIISAYDDGHVDHKFKAIPDKKFLTKLITGVLGNLASVDAAIERNLNENWSKERMDNVMLALLRVAVFELSGMPKTPFKIIINEYLDIGKAFFNEKESGFINGILDKIAKQVRE